MAVTIKTEKEIELMRIAGKYLAEVHDEMKAAIRPGISTKEINDIGERAIRKRGCIPSFLHYEGYPASVCVSVNDEVVHGIPRRNRILKEGDLVSLDCGTIYKGFQSDAARSYIVGEGSPEVKKLMEITENAFYAGIAMARPGNHLHDISNAIADYVEPYGFGIVEDLVGHGIGKRMHEDPEIPNFRQKSRGILLKKGMTLAIEPMITLGTYRINVLEDEWTCVTADGSVASHYENTILITDDYPEILSLPGGRTHL